ncbi:beta-hexosaminidase subunit beta [Coniella lustricola]|uniref:Beta-hexosaminidase n=1 Tax=Coniella lustricola TaxID=2025994 RepID=A0A2T3AIT1_9PEZI|nr:beta-hexosaminidase subunit beta [Coniella lustricola]
MTRHLLLPVVLAVVHTASAQGLGGLWPVPQPVFTSGETSLLISKDIEVTLNGASLVSSTNHGSSSVSSSSLVSSGVSRALDNIFSSNFVPWMLVPRYKLSSYEPALNGTIVSIDSLAITLTSNNSTFKPTAADADESYNLTVTEAGEAQLSSFSSTGVLRGLETFSQLFYEHSSGRAWYLVNAPIDIQDAPTYPWRGVMLDTARNFFPVADIKRTIDGLSYSKMNKLHVHVTDSQSWPLEVPSLPELSAKGAYTQSQVYSPADIQSIQEYGVARGVDVYFEIDMPGHIGVVGEAYPDLVVAYNMEPYTTYCAEPPCGALRLNNSNVEDFLGELFDDVLPRVAPYTSYWHTGGDELNAQDYLFDPDVNSNDTAVLQPLLQDFIDTQHTRIRNAGLNPLVWEEIVSTWNVTIGSDVVVQSWLGGTAVQDLAASGHKVIDSNYNYYYLDCGRGQWITWSNDLAASDFPFNDWCGPTKSWELVYSHDPAEGVTDAATKSNILGGELALWSETIDSQNLDSLAWPRASAAGEILWSGRLDDSGQNRSQIDAAPRLNLFRQRLVARGLGASPIQMEWCTLQQNASGCAQPA